MVYDSDLFTFMLRNGMILITAKGTLDILKRVPTALIEHECAQFGLDPTSRIQQLFWNTVQLWRDTYESVVTTVQEVMIPVAKVEDDDHIEFEYEF